MGLLCALGACSTLPLAGYPEHVDYVFDALVTIDESGALTVPHTRRGLVVRALELSPQPTSERFTSAGRSLSFAPGSVVRARGDVRAYRRADGALPTLAELFGHAELRR